MTELTPEKIKELTSLMANAPPATAARLLAMFERMKIMGNQVIPSNDLISAMREAGMTQVNSGSITTVRLPSFERLFFEPFEKLFENDILDRILPGSLPRAGVREVWYLIAGHFLPDDVVDLEPHGTSAILRGDIDKARELAFQLRALLLTSLAGFTNSAIARLAKTPEAGAILTRLVPLLLAEARGRDIWATAFGTKGELSEQGVASLAANVRQLEDENPEAARELLLLTMSNLPRPCEALRVLNKASYHVDDRKLDVTEFAVLGRRVIATAERAADMIEKASKAEQFDGGDLSVTVELYNQNLQGLEREANLAPDGPWRRAMVDIRKKVGNRLEMICDNVTRAVELALPVERVQRHNVMWTQEPTLHLELNLVKVETAIQGLEFIAAARLFASSAGFGAARDQAVKHASAYLDNVCEAILRASRQASKPAHLAQWVHSAASLLEALEGVKSAHVFERRVSVASAAA